MGNNVKKKKKSTGYIIGMTLLVLVLVLTVVGSAGYGVWWYLQPKFHDLTIELGTDTLGIRQFMTEQAWGRLSAFVTDPGSIDLNKVGDQQIVFRHWKKEETVTLTIQDTTPPTAHIPGVQLVPINQELDPAKLVKDVKDMSETRVYFAKAPELTEMYDDQTVTIVVEDAWGNKFSGETTLSFLWMKEEFTLELGESLTKEDLLLDPEHDAEYLDQGVLDEVNDSPVGQYSVVSTIGAHNNICTVTVQDTRGPEIHIKNVYRREGEDVTKDDFVEEITDFSGVAEVRLVGEYDINTLGTYPVILEAEDIYGNVSQAETELIISNDWDPPVLSGDFEALTVDRDSQPDFLEGITAEDELSGPCEVTVDTSALNISKPGTYYITYRASDEVGNEATMKRKIVVKHNEEDTRALVKPIADKLSDDPEQIRDYVRSHLGYNSSWGGEDPVWYGFTNKAGNCYVHALCLKVIYDMKGIENQLIWVTDKSHYWLLVKFDEGWKHVDPTPGVLHSMYSKMSDKQRLATLSGRKWDTSLWPACN